jgi:hypothetical protein
MRRSLSLSGAWLAVGLVGLLAWLVEGHSSPLGFITLLIVLEGSTLFVSLIGPLRAVRREWREGTAAYWLRFRQPAAVRLGAKLLPPLALFATLAVAVFLVALLVALAWGSLPAKAAGPHAIGALRHALLLGLSGRPQLSLLTVLIRWGLPDLVLLLAAGPPLAVFGAGFGILRVGSRTMRRLVLPGIWLAMIAAGYISQFIPPIFVLEHAAALGWTWHFLPAGHGDVVASVAPDAAITLWPLFLAWLLGALIFIAEARWLHMTARVP